jgi:hypothetical protein
VAQVRIKGRAVQLRLAWLKPPPAPVDGSMTLFEHLREPRYLVGHANTRVTELVYRKELRPVLTRGARAMDALVPRD